MAGHNRHLRGDINSIKVPSHGNTVIEPGDILMVSGVTFSPSQSGGKADFYVYPVGSVTAQAAADFMSYFKNWFVGVAMNGSVSGVTKDVTVATTGVFQYPLHTNGGTTVGLPVSGVTPGAATSSSSDQHVYGTDSGSSAYLGYAVVTQKGGSSYVDFEIKTKYGEGLIS